MGRTNIRIILHQTSSNLGSFLHTFVRTNRQIRRRITHRIESNGERAPTRIYCVQSVRISFNGYKRNNLHSTALRVLSITLWWYSYDPCEKFIRTKSALGHSVRNGEKRRTDVHSSLPEFLKCLWVICLWTFGSMSLRLAIGGEHVSHRLWR